jgi:exo-beta-1,3-glucanase (GH17 family)
MAGAPGRGFSFDLDEHSYDDHHNNYQPYDDRGDVSPIHGEHAQHAPSGYDMDPPPPPPAHRIPVNAQPDSTLVHRPYGSQNYSDLSPPGITPGADNLGERAAGGGINGIALGVANSNERESGVQALQDAHAIDGSQAAPFSDQHRYEQSIPPRPIQPQPSYGSNAPFAARGMAAGSWTASNSDSSLPLNNRPSPPGSIPYTDNPYNRYSTSNTQLSPHQMEMGIINPNEVDEDDDWGMGPQQTVQQKRRSFVPFSRDGSRESTPNVGGAAAGAGVGTAAYLAARDTSGKYNAVPGGTSASSSAPELANEKSEWLARDNHGRKRITWIVGSVIVLICIGAIVGGILGSTLGKKNSGHASDGSNANAQSVQQDNKEGLTIKSAEIQKLMNNQALHKVFPGVDYTPLNTQYPNCMHLPPSQNNITRDMAVLSQLTNAVRLYGTDCNQTEMVLEAINRLELTDMKVWLGVWLGDNDTTNSRQIDQMWTVLDDYGADRFKGIIVGNEVLYRKDLNETQLLDVITNVKTNLTDHKIDLPIATSDLGDNWTADMATKVDIVMSNVHPFFAGVTAEEGAGWTWNFWQTHDVVLTAADKNIKQVIAEVGWPSAGGTDCGEAKTCDKGSVAGIDELNTFMGDWVCQSLKNGTEYFW